MDDVGKNTELLVQSIKNCSAYKQYRKSERDLRKYPGLGEKLDLLRGRTERMELALKALHPRERLARGKEKLRHSRERLKAQAERALQQRKHSLELAAGKLQSASPLERLKGGYAFVTDENGAAVEYLRTVPEESMLHIHMRDGTAQARVTERNWRDLSLYTAKITDVGGGDECQ